MFLALCIVCEIAVMLHLWLAISSYLEIRRAGQRPRFWRWILPIPGNSEWFYHPRESPRAREDD